MNETILLVIMLVEVIIIFMIEKKNYMAIIASLIIIGLYIMGEIFYYKMYVKGDAGYSNFSPIAIIYGIVVILFTIISIYKAKKVDDKNSVKAGIQFLLLSTGLYALGKGIVLYSEIGINEITDSMRMTDFSICQVFRIIINSIVISYITSTIIKK